LLKTDEFSDWLESLGKRERGYWLSRLDRVEKGNFGDHKDVGGGVIELREIRNGPGYRVYCTKIGRQEARMSIMACALNGRGTATVHEGVHAAPQGRSPVALKLSKFDSTQYLDNEEMIAAYLQAALESEDAGHLAYALGKVAKARGMTEIAQATGLTREALYKALREDAQPRFETLSQVLNAIGLRFSIEPARQMPTAVKVTRKVRAVAKKSIKKVAKTTKPTKSSAYG
jgi:probable addiction module antidote protein/putative addiction module killer protein